MFMGLEKPVKKKVVNKKPVKKKVVKKKPVKKKPGKKGPPLGNEFYKLRLKNGRDKIFPTPEDLWIACCEYFEYVEANPLEEERAFSTKFGIKKVKLSKKRAMTLAGLRVYIGISLTGYAHYTKREEYQWVTKAVTDIMYAQKFEGASAGLFNPLIIARELGLADKQNITSDVKVTKKNFSDFYLNGKK